VTPRSPCDHRALDTLFAQKLRVAWAEDPKRRPVRGVEARRRLRLPRGVGHLQCEDELHVLGLAGGGLDGKVGVLVSVDEEETAAAPSNDREASRRRGASPADDRRELTAVQNRATGSRAGAMNELVGKERWRRAWSDGVTRGRSHRRDRAHAYVHDHGTSPRPIRRRNVTRDPHHRSAQPRRVHGTGPGSGRAILDSGQFPPVVGGGGPPPA
jgi:hypothetical protein